MKNLSANFGLIVFIFLFGAISVYAQSGRGAGNARVEKRLALVIGNGDYADAPLKNPANDATDMAAVLREVGFEVTLQINLNQNDMKRAIRTFGENLKKSGGVGLFYYAGHGVQVKGVNYLIPVGATASNEQEVEYEAVEAGVILAQMEAANNATNIVILDACRNNPFARSYRSGDKGLAQMNAPSGSLIAYATAPGSIALDGGAGRNGIYTAELLKQLKTPDLDIKNIFQQVRVSVRNSTQNKQTPWESISLTGDFYFKSNKSPVVVNKPVNPIVSDESAASERTFWESVKDSKDVEDYKDYLDKFPNGLYSGIARRKIQSLQGKKPAPEKTNNQPVSPATRSWAVDSSLFTFELLKCRLSGTTVFCDFTITNNDQDRYLSINGGSYLFDDFNNEVRSNRIELANEASYGVRAYLVSGIKTRARIIFDKVSAEATTATLISISLDSDNTQAFNVRYRNIPLRETATRSLNSAETVDNGETGAVDKVNQTPANRDNNIATVQVKPGHGWIDSGINISPGMKIELMVSGGLTAKVDNSVYGNILSDVFKRRINVPATSKRIGGKALVAKIRYQKGGDSNVLTIGDQNTLTAEAGEYGRLYFAVSDKYSSAAGELTVILKW